MKTFLKWFAVPVLAVLLVVWLFAPPRLPEKQPDTPFQQAKWGYTPTPNSQIIVHVGAGELLRPELRQQANYF